jgi:leader peptidase (prepilin peptidase) / N-methyltransferase
MPLDAAHVIVVLFAAVFGGCVGSFLNVVVYRLPNGLSLISPPSHCPQCKEPIRWYDNVPVFGWIMLGGRCRHCHCWIPIRYPLVEAFTAAMFAALAVVENPLAAAYSTQIVLLCTLLCSALIEVDGNGPPPGLFIPALIVDAADMLIAPTDRLAVWAGLAAGVVAVGAIWLLFVALSKLPRKNASAFPSPGTGLPLGLLGVGPVLGWQGLTAVAVVSVGVWGLLLLAGRGESRFNVPPSVWLLIATLTWLLVP